jgi:hypothetical protein
MFMMPPPGILVGRPRDAEYGNITYQFWAMGTQSSPERAASLTERDPSKRSATVPIEFPIGDFCKLLAKIAHGLAVAQYGYGSFSSLLTDLIRAPRENALEGPFYVGGAYFADGSLISSIANGHMHEARLFPHVHEEKPPLMARIQLFAPFGAPVYDVVVGTI